MGLYHYQELFADPAFIQAFKNTVIINIYNLIFGFTFNVFLALMINELQMKRLKSVVQTCVYLPYFLSWVIFAGLVQVFLQAPVPGDVGGVVNQVIQAMGGEPIDFMKRPEMFRGILVITNIIKTAGYSTIIYLAALSSVDTQLYEAAKIDGAGRWQLMWHVTLPAIRGTIILMLIMKVGSLLNTGYEQIFLMQNAMNRSVSDVFDTYIYTKGIVNGQYSLATAAGLFKSIVSMVMVIGANKIAKLFGESGLY